MATFNSQLDFRKNNIAEVSLIMSRVSAGLFDDVEMDKTLLLNLELKRSERRRNLRYRTSVALDPENVPVAKAPEKIQKRVEKTVDEYAKELEQWLKKMKCTGVTGVRLESFKDINVGVSNEPLDPSSPSLEPYPNIWSEKHTYKGYRDENGRAKGRAVIVMENGDEISGIFHEGLRHGECRIETSRLNLSHMVGNYVNDQLEGIGKLTFANGHQLEGFFRHGVLTGFVRKYDEKNRLTDFGLYENGKACYIWWKLFEFGGAVIGHVNDEGQLTGSEIVYLYPDFKTGFLGHFEDGVLVQAQAVQLEAVVEDYKSGCDKFAKLLTPLFSDPAGPYFRRDVSDFVNMTKEPLLPDPYETEWVEVRPSTVPFANEGLFARHSVESGQILAFYNGIRKELRRSWDKPDWVKSAYRIFDPTRDDPGHGGRGSLDIPPEYVDFNNYCASLSHKTNHSFLPSAEFEVFHHPRFGLIPCLMSSTSIQAGEEIFVHYGYTLEHCPDWFTDAWATENYPVPESFKVPRQEG